MSLELSPMLMNFGIKICVIFSSLAFTCMMHSQELDSNTLYKGKPDPLKELFKEDIKRHIGNELPKFNLESLSSNEQKDSESLKGKPTLINIWFIECAPCIEEIPLLNRLQERYNERINFVAITFQDSEKVKKYLLNSDFNFTHLVNAKSYIRQLGLITYPKTIIIDKNLRVVNIESGLVSNKNSLTNLSDKSKIEERIADILNSLLE